MQTEFLGFPIVSSTVELCLNMVFKKNLFYTCNQKNCNGNINQLCFVFTTDIWSITQWYLYIRMYVAADYCLKCSF